MSIDLTGNEFGWLTVLNKAESQKGQTKWNCICRCGNVSSYFDSNLKRKTKYDMTKSCGCNKYNGQKKRCELLRKQELGKKYNNSLIIGTLKSKGQKSQAICQCHCGKEFITSMNHLKNNAVRSCGCLKRIPNYLDSAINDLYKSYINNYCIY